MSKFNELDHTRVQQAEAVAQTLHEALRDNGYLSGDAAYFVRWETMRELLTAVLLGGSNNYPCHDWIGEALVLREKYRVCMESLEVMQQDRDEARERGLLWQAEAEAGVRENPKMTEADLVEPPSRRQVGEFVEPRPITGFAIPPEETPANGYVMLTEGYTSGGVLGEGAYMKRGSLDELIDDYVMGGSAIHELGVEFKPERELRWVEVKS